MSQFQPHIAAMRFGTGRSPHHQDPASVRQMLTNLRAADHLAARYPVGGMDGIAEAAQTFHKLRAQRKSGEITEAAYKDAANAFRQEETRRAYRAFAATMARGIAAPDGFRDRLVLFWADHFALEGKDFLLRRRADAYTEEAIRPFVTGRFADLLRAAVLHPMMISFLDQHASVGPNSDLARDTPGRGLNENLAREILELHTLGVQGSYVQDDVRQFAELLAGVTLNGRRDMVFSAKRAEPGAETVLDVTSPADKARLKDVHRVLDRLAVHPDTARHIATKLAVHFVSDDPAPDLVLSMAARFRDTGGDLMAVYEAMLQHPASWAVAQHKVKRPVEYVLSALRALRADPDLLVRFAAERPGPVLKGVMQPMQRMGQQWGRPGGPDGWPETPSEWVTPNALAERMRWAIRIQAAQGMRPADPMEVLDAALGPYVDARLRFAVGAAETREEAVALVLMSPHFQRR